MNRAAKRQQKSLARAARKQRGQRPLGQAAGGLSTTALSGLVQQGLQLHQAGQVQQAERIYRQVLGIDPDHPDANHLLGFVADQVGNHVQAVELICRAIAAAPNEPVFHHNLGNALKAMGRLDGAIASYHKALAIKPDLAETHNNLGATLKALGRLDDAVASYRKALAIKPDYADAHNNLGNALNDLRRLDDAVASYRKALAIKSDYAEAHNNLGSALKAMGRLDDAIASYHKALAIKSDYAEAHNNLGNALQELERFDDALTCHRRAVALGPRNDVFWACLAKCLERVSFTSVDDSLFQDLASLLVRPTLKPMALVRPVLSALRHHPDFARLLQLTRVGIPESEFVYADVAESLTAIPLLHRIMEITPIDDLPVERMLTRLRRTMIRETMLGKRDETDLPLCAALALHCFANEYVFAETAEEKAAVEQLQQKMAVVVESGQDLDPALVAALGAYRPLHRFPWAKKLLEHEWTGAIKGVIQRQIAEPIEEHSLRSQVPRLTSIQDTVSQAVREQYEENPYPRWIKTGAPNEAKTIEDVLHGSSLHFDLEDYVSPANPQVLVAGCGTGQHALATASTFLNAHVLAVDLSLSSLAYAMRKTRELDISNIEYAQADIMELRDIGRQFDLIECGGVLHHLGDPLSGWRVLVDLLRPGGLMRIALYSEIARQPVVKALALIAEEGYSPSSADIRRCRQDIVARKGDPEMSRVAAFRDFFSMSECRDLLFHVQEHRFTLPRIEEALKSLMLKFLGFEMRDQGPLKAFKKSYPESGALTSPCLWHEFELKHPNTFLEMYQFWCRKA